MQLDRHRQSERARIGVERAGEAGGKRRDAVLRAVVPRVHVTLEVYIRHVRPGAPAELPATVCEWQVENAPNEAICVVDHAQIVVAPHAALALRFGYTEVGVRSPKCDVAQQVIVRLTA